MTGFLDEAKRFTIYTSARYELAEVAEMRGVTVGTVRRYRREEDFPAPLEWRRGWTERDRDLVIPVWGLDQIIAWGREHQSTKGTRSAGR